MAASFESKPVDDLILMPLLFLWRQTIELTLKATIRDLCALRRKQGDTLAALLPASVDDRLRSKVGHNLKKLTEELATHLEAVGAQATPGDVLETLEDLRQQLEAVYTALTDTFLDLPESEYLLSVHGLGIITAATILSEIGDPRHYTRAPQLIKLAGTQPVPNASGRKSRSKTPMSHKGRPRLRKALFFAVLRLIQVDDAFAREYLRLQTREKNPLIKMQALGVLMNKLLRILWALMRNCTFYTQDFQNAV